MLVAIGRYSISNLLRNLLRHQLAIKPFNMGDVSRWKEEIDHLNEDNAIRIATLERISAKRKSSTDDAGESQPSISTPELLLPLHLDPNATRIFCRWGILLLKLMIEKSYCMLYQPLIHVPLVGLSQELPTE